MLRVTLHAGSPEERCPANQLMALDIGYQLKAPLANYIVSMTLHGQGELEPDFVLNYPRWSGSLWDLVGRALTRIIFRQDEPPASPAPDKRCAYATRLCVFIETHTLSTAGVEIGRGVIYQRSTGRGQRGHYTVELNEDLGPQRTAEFAYGQKRLNVADLLLRSICWALHGADVLGPKPLLIMPRAVEIDGQYRFQPEALDEPARTGFERFRRSRPNRAPEPMEPTAEYVTFLMKG